MGRFTPSNVSFIGGGTSGGGSGGGLDAAEVDARIATWARAVAPSGTAPVARLPGLRQRYARYQFTIPFEPNDEAGDFDPELNVTTLVTVGNINTAESTLDQWSENDHPWDIDGGYIDFSRINENEQVIFSVQKNDNTFVREIYRLSIRDDNNAVIRNVPLYAGQTGVAGDVRPFGVSFIEPLATFIKPPETNATRGFIQSISVRDLQDEHTRSVVAFSFLGAASYG